MPILTGYLLIADISGYTAYLTSTEMEHATPVITSLLEVLMERLGDPLHLWRVEGDAVLAYTTDPRFPDGATFLTICEDLYVAFAARRQDIVANTTCPCRACAQVPTLDLKVIVHHGPFQEVKLGPMRDISGSDVILVHRMTKTAVKQATGVQSYALLSESAWVAMGSPKGLHTHTESFEHFGPVSMHVHDLARAWERIRAARERVFVATEEGILTRTVRLPTGPRATWQLLMSPQARVRWMGMRSVTVYSDDDRPGPGALYHCVHEQAEFQSTVLDWAPFHYVSNRYVCPFDPSLVHDETYEIVEVEGGCEVRYTAGPMYVPGDRGTAGGHPEVDAQIVALYGPFYDAAFGVLAGMASDGGGSG